MLIIAINSPQRNIPTQKRINQALLQMERDLKHSSLETKKLKGTNSIWETRASKSLRITFNLKGKLIILRTAPSKSSKISE